MKKIEAVGANILYLMKLHGVNQTKMAAVIGCSVNTFGNRIRHPGEFRVDEIRRMAAFFKVDGASLLNGERTA